MDNYSEYLFYNQIINLLKNRSQICQQRLDSIESKKQFNIAEKRVPTLTSEDLDVKKKLEDEIVKINHDLGVVEPVFDDVADAAFKSIEKKSGQKLKTLKVIRTPKIEK